MFAQFVATATGTLYALMSDDVHARHSWQNATTCAPRCAPNESCCIDPESGFLWTASPAGEVWYQARTADKNVVPQLAAVALNGSVVRRSAPLEDRGCPDDAIGCDVQFLFADGA